MARVIRSRCRRVKARIYKNSMHIYIKSKVFNEVIDLESDLKSRGLDFDICTLLQLGLDAYKKDFCS